MATYTSKEEVDTYHRQLKETFASGLTKDLAWRKWQLKQLWWLFQDNEERMWDAVQADLHCHRLEASVLTNMIKDTVLHHLKHIEEWTTTKSVEEAGIIMGWLGGGRVRKEPLGTTFIIGAWNVPFYSTIMPLISAITAGCCAIIKPPEMARSNAALITELVPKYLDPRAIRVVTGGPAETTYMLTKRWNHIFFTGSSKIGRIVATAAAKHLTPIVLELGGQGPCIITKTGDVDLAAKRLAYLKYSNAGQLCISANHVFVEPEVADLLLERLVYWNEQLLRTTNGGESGKDHLARIIDDRNFNRLAGLLEKTQGRVIYGGLEVSDPASRFFHPTVVHLGSLTQADGTSAIGDSLMSEEIFGPILPIITATLPDALQAINSMPEPLVLYIFSREPVVAEAVLDATSSGGVTINNVIMHVTLANAPFGGVGESGYGTGQGLRGVDAFCHHRTVVAPPTWIDRLVGFLYPPYDEKNISKITVKNTLGFKRGETIEDQRRSKTRDTLGSVGKVFGVTSVVGLVAAAWKGLPVREALLSLGSKLHYK